MNLKNYIKSLLLDPIFRNLQYSVFRQKWNIGITSHSAAVVAGLDGARMQRRALDDLLWMDESRNAFAADPFIALRPGSNDEYFVFFENYLWKKGQGTINLAKFSNQKFGRSELLLDSPFHLSYPYVLYDNGKIYLIPEHSQSRNLSLYKFDEVQENLTSKFTIGNNLNFVDSSIISFKGKYWMFCTKSGENDNSDLYIYYSDGLNMPWRMHAGNPVKRDISNARPAGQFIFHAGKWFRPAQDCQTHYGAAIIINELKTLTEDEFEETQVSEVRPEIGSRYEYGLHTISSAGNVTVIDGARIESTIHRSLDGFGRYILARARAH